MHTKHSSPRYLVTIINNNRNLLKSRVQKDLTDALLVSHAESGMPAVYRNKDKQLALMQKAYQYFSDLGGVWTAALAKVSMFPACV